ncbi:MAG: ShlB/FhaC/HecB family hemolysin secretion/activation protein [Candidatus Omnitrophota bacterium]
MKYVKILLIVIFCAVLSVLPQASFAQSVQTDVDRATTQVDRTISEEAEKKLKVKVKKPPEIKEEEEEEEKPEGPKFFVRKIKLVGTESFPPEEFSHILEKYENKNVSMQDLNTLAKEIEREYLKRGIIAACFVPPQDVKDGVVTLRVVEAKMGVLNIKEHKYFDKARIANYWRIKPGEVLRYDEMSRDLQRMNKNPDRDVNAVLHAGEKPGTTDVLIEADTKFPVHPFFSFNNEGVRSTGREQYGFGIKHNNALFVDDTVLVGWSLGEHFSGVYAYHVVPITNIGTSFMYGFSDSRSRPEKEFKQFDIRSWSQTGSFFLTQDLFKKAEYLGEISMGLDVKDKKSSGLTGTINRDRLRILRFRANLIHKYPGTITTISPQFSQGLNFLGARSKNPLSSRAADSVFSKFDLGIRHRRALPLNFQAVLNFKCQFASEKLTPQEEFSLGGINSVRGYPSGDYLADIAFLTNFELLIPAFFIPETVKLPYAKQPLRDSLTGVFFVDQGYGEKRGALPTETKKDNLFSIGTGLRIRMFDMAYLRLEWGFPLGEDPITERANSRFHLSLDFQY